MPTWTRKEQECAGDYHFDGRGVMTQGVAQALSSIEIADIYADLRAAVEAEDGLDYLQVYESGDGRRVWCICQLSGRMKRSGEFTPAQLEEYDYWTMLLPTEY